MKGKSRISYLANPALGLVPLLLYSFLVNFFNYQWSLFICFIVGVGCMKGVPYLLKKKIYPLFLFIIVGILGVCSLVSLIPVESMLTRFYIRLLPDYLLYGFVVFILFDKKAFIRHMMKLQNKYLFFSIKTNLYEYFFVLKILFYFYSFYLVVALGYITFCGDWHSPEMHLFILGKLRFLIVASILILSQVRLYWLNRRFKNEEWLPIIDENAQVIGRVAASVSYQFKERYLHPHIRILIFYKGMIYLKPRETYRKIEIGYQDTPLARDMRFMQDAPYVVDHLMKKAGFSSHDHPRFFSRYIFEVKPLRRMVFLYTLIVPDESCFSHKVFQKGKLWTEQEIENNIGKQVFSTIFEEEFELLKTAVFPIIKMMS